MTSSDHDDWKNLGAAWKAESEPVEVSETALTKRLWRRRVILGVQTSAEILSFILAAIVALWIRLQPTSSRLGTLLLGWLLLQTAIILRLRIHRSTADTASVLDALDARIEQDTRFLQSLRLGSVMSMLALAALVLAIATTLFQRAPQWSPTLIVAIGLFALYVFAIQAAIVLWTRHIRRCRKKLENVRQALSAPE